MADHSLFTVAQPCGTFTRFPFHSSVKTSTLEVTTVTRKKLLLESHRAAALEQGRDRNIASSLCRDAKTFPAVRRRVQACRRHGQRDGSEIASTAGRSALQVASSLGTSNRSLKAISTSPASNSSLPRNAASSSTRAQAARADANALCNFSSSDPFEWQLAVVQKTEAGECQIKAVVRGVAD